MIDMSLFGQTGLHGQEAEDLQEMLRRMGLASDQAGDSSMAPSPGLAVQGLPMAMKADRGAPVRPTTENAGSERPEMGVPLPMRRPSTFSTGIEQTPPSEAAPRDVAAPAPRSAAIGGQTLTSGQGKPAPSAAQLNSYSPSISEHLINIGKGFTGQGASDLSRQADSVNLTARALQKAGVDTDLINAAVRNPDLMKSILAMVAGKGGRGKVEANKNILWGRRKKADGTEEVIPLQSNDAGEINPSQIPNGVEVIAKPEKVDLGTHWGFRSPDGTMAYEKKNVQEEAFERKLGMDKAEFEAKRPQLLLQAKGKMRSLHDQWKLVDDSIAEAKKLIQQQGMIPATGFGSFLQSIPHTDALRLKNLLETIRANIGFDKLQDMRDNSPTGGALGQVSEFENRLLQAVRGSLQQEQDGPDLIKNLDRVKDDLKALQEDRTEAFGLQFGVPYGNAAPPPNLRGVPDQPPSGARTGKDGKTYIPDPNRPGKYLEWVPEGAN